MPTSKTGRDSREALASKVTARAQTTLPAGVRKALGLRAGDRIEYTIEGDRAVIRKLEEDDDPALRGFLELLEADLRTHKGRVLFATERFAEELARLTEGVPVDYEAPIEGEFEF